VGRAVPAPELTRFAEGGAPGLGIESAMRRWKRWLAVWLRRSRWQKERLEQFQTVRPPAQGRKLPIFR